MPRNAPDVTVERVRCVINPSVCDINPSVYLFSVTVCDSIEERKHIATSEQDLHSFIEGVRAGVAAMGSTLGRVDIPSVPARRVHAIHIR
jgi:hypothetical protein